MASKESDWQFELALQAEKDRQENNRVHLREVAIYHRNVITMMFLIMATSATVFSGMFVYYVNLSSHRNINVQFVHTCLAAIGVVVSIAFCVSQHISIRAYVYVTIHYARPAFQRIGTRPEITSDMGRQRKRFDFVCWTLLMISHVVYLAVWLALLVLD